MFINNIGIINYLFIAHFFVAHPVASASALSPDNLSHVPESLATSASAPDLLQTTMSEQLILEDDDDVIDEEIDEEERAAVHASSMLPGMCIMHVTLNHPDT